MALWARCDGVAACADASDERGCARASCAALGPAAERCGAGGACYLPAWRCDNHTDCPGGEDEANCTQHIDVTQPLTHTERAPASPCSGI